jgi:hypothetical protein
MRAVEMLIILDGMTCIICATALVSEYKVIFITTERSCAYL